MTALMQRAGGPMPLREVVDRLFERSFSPLFGNGESGIATTVPTNVWETADGYQLALLLPGVDPQAIEVSAAGNTITVTGAMQVNQPEGGRFVWQEFGTAQFRRQIRLPAEFDADNVGAEYRNGVLLLSLPKAEHSKARTIKISVK